MQWFVFITCQNFQFWQLCSFLGLFVRLSVCLFVCYQRNTGHTVWAINTKLDTNMEPVWGMSCILFGVDDVTDDIIRSKRRRSNFEIGITSPIFELERRSKPQNVGHALGFPAIVLNFWWHFRRKTSPNPKILSFGKFLKYSMQLQFDIRYGKIVPNCARKNVFMVMTSSMTSQEDLKIPLYSLINEKWSFFVRTEHITETSSLYLVICVPLDCEYAYINNYGLRH